jgi:hypothetical protein
MSQHGSNSPERQEVESTEGGHARGHADKADQSPDHSIADASTFESPVAESPVAESLVAESSLGKESCASPDEASAINSVVDRSEPIAADDPGDVASVRIGSPFAVDPFTHDPARAIEAFYDVGPLKYTAMGAVSASLMVVGFAAAATYFFPIGGTMIAALGCVLSIFGMYSSYRLTAAGLLAIHLCLFVLSYGRTLS